MKRLLTKCACFVFAVGATNVMGMDFCSNPDSISPSDKYGTTTQTISATTTVRAEAPQPKITRLDRGDGLKIYENRPVVAEWNIEPTENLHGMVVCFENSAAQVTYEGKPLSITIPNLYSKDSSGGEIIRLTQPWYCTSPGTSVYFVVTIPGEDGAQPPRPSPGEYVTTLTMRVSQS